jgi:hypothetical protein
MSPAAFGVIAKGRTMERDEQKAERAATAPLTNEERAKLLDPTFGGSPDAIFSAVLGILGNRGIDVPAVVKMNPAHIIFYLDDVKRRTHEIPSLSAKVDELAKTVADLDGTRRQLIKDVADVRIAGLRIVERVQGLERHDADTNGAIARLEALRLEDRALTKGHAERIDAIEVNVFGLEESRKLHSATLAHLAQTEDSLVEGSMQTDKRVDEITHRAERLASTTLRGMEDVLARIDAMARRVGTAETALHGDVAKWRESIDGRIGEIAADVRELIGARNRHEEGIYASSAKAEQARELAKTSHGTDAAPPATENLESAAPARWVTPAWNVKPGINDIPIDPPIHVNAGDTIGVALEMPAGARVYGGHADTVAYTVDGWGKRKYETPTITLIGPPAAPVDDVAGEYVDDVVELIDDQFDSDPAWGLVVVRVSRDGETRIEGPAASAAIFWEAWARVDDDRGDATT